MRTPLGASPTGNPYVFTGRRHDPETGLHYYRYRYYDATRGRFISRDPVGYEAGIHLYAYCESDPLAHVDPLGFLSREACKELRARIIRNGLDLLDDLRRYNPVEDAKGGHPKGPKKGGGVTIPGGHYKEINQRKDGLKEKMARYIDECLCGNDDDDDPMKRVPRWIDQMVARPVPPPVPHVTPFDRLVIAIPGSDRFWQSVGITAGVVGSAAAIGAGFGFASPGALPQLGRVVFLF